MKWLGDGEPVLMKDLDEAHAKIERYRALSATPPLGFWAVEIRATGVVAGSVLLLELPNAEDHEVEIGWHLHPDSWGQGFASEAAPGAAGARLRRRAAGDPRGHPPRQLRVAGCLPEDRHDRPGRRREVVRRRRRSCSGSPPPSTADAAVRTAVRAGSRGRPRDGSGVGTGGRVSGFPDVREAPAAGEA